MDRETKHDFELGAQGSLLTSGEVSRGRIYGFAHHETRWFSDTSPTRWRVDAALRGWTGTTIGFDPRSAVVERADDHTNIAVGLQQIVWGETFGLPIADLVHPRDLRDPLLFDMDWVRLPVPAANVQLLFDSLRIQAVAVPFPRNNILPKHGTTFDPFHDLPHPLPLIPVQEPRSFPLDRFGRDGEYGGRVSYLFEFGLDVALLYYFHWNRTPVYELLWQSSPVPIPSVFAPVQDRVHGTGLTFTQAFDDWVLRGDFVVHPREPVADDALGPARRVTHLQGVLGADRTTEGNWTFGVQAHYDDRGIRSLFWGSAQIKKALFDGRLEPQLFVFMGIDNSDRWIQPRIDWHVIDPWTVSLRADFVWGSLDDRRGDLGLVDGKHRVLGCTSLRF